MQLSGSVTAGLPVPPINPHSVGSNMVSRRNSCRTSIDRSSLGSNNYCDNGNSGSVFRENGSSNKKVATTHHGQGDKGQGGYKVYGGDCHNP